MTIAQTQGRDQTRLMEALGLEKPEARLETQVLLSHALGVSKAFLIAHRDEYLPSGQEIHYQSLLERRLTGEPIAYILGEREFYSLVFKATPAVLIPRPETELLVELALTHIPQDNACQVLDLGTGSGAVGITIAKHRPNARVTAVDQSADSLAVARENAKLLHTDNVTFCQSDWYNMLGVRKFDIIVANPPYIRDNDPHLSQGDLRFEPISALAAGADGLSCIRAIVQGAQKHLLPEGWLLFEHGYDQADQCQILLRENGFCDVESVRDLSNVQRVTQGTFKIP